MSILNQLRSLSKNIQDQTSYQMQHTIIYWNKNQTLFYQIIYLKPPIFTSLIISSSILFQPTNSSNHLPILCQSLNQYSIKLIILHINLYTHIIKSIQRYMLIGSLDQSTTSTKFAIFKPNGEILTQSIKPHQQISHNEGWLEHNPEEIIQNIQQCFQQAIEKLKQNNYQLHNLKGIGICNQRQTVVAWDVDTGKSLNNAIVWCDTRTSKIAEQFGKKHPNLKQKTGLVPSSYFSLFKILWLLENNPEIKKKLEQGKVRFGTIDTWVIYNLTGKYVTDASNASRTFLYNLKGHWDNDILSLVGLKQEFLPKVVDSFSRIGEISKGCLKGFPIGCVLGDQQSSAYAHNLQKNHIKCSYGTGCFLIMNLGKQPKVFKNFVTTILHKNGDQIQYGLEASIEAGAGILNWLKNIEMFKEYQQLNNLPDNKGVLFYPTFGSIYAPFWSSNTTGTFVGMGPHSNKQNILRSVLDSICFRINDNVSSEQMPEIESFRADGGMTKNNNMMQFQADLLNIGVKVCVLDTLWGVGKGALKGLGLENEVQIQSVVHEFKPSSQQRHKKAVELYEKWNSQRWRSEKWN